MSSNSRTLQSAQQQYGIGLVEVLVALLLFSSAALGYAALHNYAISSQSSSVKQLQALMLLQQAVERIRANSQLQDLTVYQAHFKSINIRAEHDCLQRKGCDPKQVAKNDVIILRRQAAINRLTLKMVVCPTAQSETKSMCLIAAWNRTKAGVQIKNTGSNEGGLNIPVSGQGKTHAPINCLKADGSYTNQGNCVMVELY